MRKLTKNIGRSTVFPESYTNLKIEVKRVLICRPNHKLGNLILITPLVQEVIATFPECKIDLFVKGNLAPIILRNYENINSIIELPKRPFQHLIKYILSWAAIKKQQYDLVISADKTSSSGRLSVQFASSKYKFFNDQVDELRHRFADYEHNAKNPVYNLRNFSTNLGIVQNGRPIALLDLKLSPVEIAEGRRTLQTLVANNNKTICLFTYATGNKCYSVEWWEDFYRRLKTVYYNFNIIEVLPIQNISALSFKAANFYSRDIRIVGSLIANTELFIGADSGMMHLASAVKTTTVGLFSVTDEAKYGPYNDLSVAINTNTHSMEKCIDILNGILFKQISRENRPALEALTTYISYHFSPGLPQKSKIPPKSSAII